MSQFEGFFGQLAFQTANFLGRGESLSLQVQAGSLAQNYSAAFTEPFLFDRNMSGGIQVFRQDIQYLSQFTQRSTGGNVGFGFPLADFTRMFLNYSYQSVRVTNVNPIFLTPAALAGNPYLQDTLLIGQGGARTVSKVTPSIVHNTVDSPIFPTTGRRFTVSVDLAGLGGDTNFYKPLVEGVWYLKQSNRTSFGFRAQASYIAAFSGTTNLPIFEKLFSGRRVQRPRLRHPVDRPARRLGARRRRQQAAAVQRRVPDQYRRAGAPGDVLRCRAGGCEGAELRDESVQDVDRPRNPVPDARHEHPLPVDLRVQSPALGRAGQQSAAAEGVFVPLRRGVHVLTGTVPSGVPWRRAAGSSSVTEAC